MGEAAEVLPGSGRRVWQGTAAALCATLVGIGLARFGYTPLIPPLIAAHWFSPAQAAYLGAANLAGYLAGALLGRPLAARLKLALVLRAMMVLATAAFFACAAPVSVAWYSAWRFAAGLSGGALMVLAAPAVLPLVPAARRGLASGVIFTGVGLGVAASGTLVPLLLRFGLVATWCGLGAVAVLLTLASWNGWPDVPPPPAMRHPPRGGTALRALYVEYGLIAVGFVPHMIFLVDFVARGLGRGLAQGAAVWVCYGLGAALGPLASGRAADRAGFRTTLRGIMAMEVIAVSVPLWTASLTAIAASAALAGACTPGVVAVVLGRAHELAPDDPRARQAAWSLCTTMYALFQAAAAYGLSAIFATTGGAYRPLFAIGAGAFAAGLLLDVAMGQAGRRCRGLSPSA